MSADVIHLYPEQPVSCVLCSHALVSENGTYCQLFAETIFAERTTAEDCGEYTFEEGRL